MYLYKVGTRSSVLFKQGVLISEVFFKRGSTVANIVSIREGTHLWVTHKNQFLTTKPEGEDQQST